MPTPTPAKNPPARTESPETASPPAPRDAYRYLYPLTILAALLLIVPPAILRPLQSSDEGRYAEVAREAAVDGHWLIPTMNGVPHLTKSPVYTDLVAVAFRLFGMHLFSARLVSLLAFLAALLGCMRWAEKRGGRRAALLCALATLTMLHPVAAGQFGDLNMLLTACLTLGMLLLEGALQAGAGAGAWAAAWAMLGVAFLVKGPPALLIPGGTLLIYRWLSGRPLGRGGRAWAWGLALFFVIGLSWYGWILADQGRMLMKFWVTDVFQRTSLNKTSKPLYYYVFYFPVFLGCSSGWGVCMLQHFLRAARERRRAGGAAGWGRAALGALKAMPTDEQWLLAWVAATLLVFSALRSEMITYIQPAYPAAALLLSLHAARRWERPGVARLFARWAWLGAAVTLLGTWGGAAGMALWTARGELTKNTSQSVEYGILARKLAAWPTRHWELVQCNFYAPMFCYLTGRNAVLCDAEIHKGWPMPPQWAVTREELRRRLQAGRPLMVLLRRKHLKKYLPAPIAGVRVVAKGPSLVLVTNLPD